MLRQEENYYTKLGIDPYMPHAELKTLLKRKWLELHPDKVVARAKYNNPDFTAEELKKIHQQAEAESKEYSHIYKKLSDEVNRAAYNQSLSTSTQPQQEDVLALPKPKDGIDYLIDLPLELFEKIFNYLDSKDIRVLSLLSKQAYAVFGAIIPGLQSYRVNTLLQDYRAQGLLASPINARDLPVEFLYVLQSIKSYLNNPTRRDSTTYQKIARGLLEELCKPPKKALHKKLESMLHYSFIENDWKLAETLLMAIQYYNKHIERLPLRAVNIYVAKVICKNDSASGLKLLHAYGYNIEAVFVEAVLSHCKSNSQTNSAVLNFFMMNNFVINPERIDKLMGANYEKPVSLLRFILAYNNLVNFNPSSIMKYYSIGEKHFFNWLDELTVRTTLIEEQSSLQCDLPLIISENMRSTLASSEKKDTTRDFANLIQTLALGFATNNWSKLLWIAAGAVIQQHSLILDNKFEITMDDIANHPKSKHYYAALQEIMFYALSLSNLTQNWSQWVEGWKQSQAHLETAEVGSPAMEAWNQRQRYDYQLREALLSHIAYNFNKNELTVNWTISINKFSFMRADEETKLNKLRYIQNNFAAMGNVILADYIENTFFNVRKRAASSSSTTLVFAELGQQPQQKKSKHESVESAQQSEASSLEFNSADALSQLSTRLEDDTTLLSDDRGLDTFDSEYTLTF